MKKKTINPVKFIHKMIETQKFLHSEMELQSIKDSIILDLKKKDKDLQCQMLCNYKKYFLILYYLKTQPRPLPSDTFILQNLSKDAPILNKTFIDVWNQYKSTFQVKDMKSIKNNPEKYKKFMFLVYSFAPSKHGFFLEKSKYMEYFDFLKTIINEKSFFKHFLSPIFLSPNVVYFVSNTFKYAILDFFHKYKNIPSSDNILVLILLNEWKKNISLCPNILVDLFSTFENSRNDHIKIMIYFFKSLFGSQNLFNIAYYYTKNDPSFKKKVADILLIYSSKLPNLYDFIQANKIITLPGEKLSIPLVFDSLDIKFLENMKAQEVHGYTLYQQEISNENNIILNEESVCINNNTSINLRKLLKISEPFPVLNESQIRIFDNPYKIYQFIKIYCVNRGSTTNFNKRNIYYKAFKKENKFDINFEGMKYIHKSKANAIHEISLLHDKIVSSNNNLSFCLENLEKILSVNLMNSSKNIENVPLRLALEFEMHNSIKFNKFLEDRDDMLIMDTSVRDLLSIHKVNINNFPKLSKVVNIIQNNGLETDQKEFVQELETYVSHLFYALSAYTNPFQKYLDIKYAFLSISRCIQREIGLKYCDSPEFRLILYDLILKLFNPPFLFSSIIFVYDYIFSDNSFLMKKIESKGITPFQQEITTDKSFFLIILGLLFKLLREEGKMINIHENFFLKSQQLNQNIIICGDCDDSSLKTNILLSGLQINNPGKFDDSCSSQYLKQLAMNTPVLTLNVSIRSPKTLYNVSCTVFNLRSPNKYNNLKEYILKNSIPIHAVLVVYDSTDKDFKKLKAMLKLFSQSAPILICHNHEEASLKRVIKNYTIFSVYNNDYKETILRIIEEMLIKQNN